MSRGNRLHVSAVRRCLIAGAAVLLVAVLAQAQVSKKPDGKGGAGGDQGQAVNIIQTAPSDLPKAQEPEPRDYEAICDKAQTHDEADLCQQWRSAKAAEKTADFAESQYWVAVWSAVGLFLTLVATALAAWAAANAAKSADAAVEITRTHGEQQLRAYVSMKAVTFKPLGPTGSPLVNSYKIGIAWENTGPTPALWVKFGTNAAITAGPLAADFDFPDMGPIAAVPLTIGPHQTTLPDIEFTSEQLWTVESTAARLYIWAWVEYSDVFAGSPRHRSEVCYEIVPMGDVRREGGTFGTPAFGPFNGMDESCSQQPKTQKG